MFVTDEIGTQRSQSVSLWPYQHPKCSKKAFLAFSPVACRAVFSSALQHHDWSGSESTSSSEHNCLQRVCDHKWHALSAISTFQGLLRRMSHRISISSSLNLVPFTFHSKSKSSASSKSTLVASGKTSMVLVAGPTSTLSTVAEFIV